MALWGGRDFYFLANTGWNAFDEQGRKLPGVAPVESAVWSLTLNAGTSRAR